MATKMKVPPKMPSVAIYLPPTLAHVFWKAMHSVLNGVDGATIALPASMSDEEVSAANDAFDMIEHQLTERIIGTRQYELATLAQQVEVERFVRNQRAAHNPFPTAKK